MPVLVPTGATFVYVIPLSKAKLGIKGRSDKSFEQKTTHSAFACPRPIMAFEHVGLRWGQRQQGKGQGQEMEVGWGQ
jgi:hypothetical protein